MKKLFLPILIVLVFALTACGGETPTLEDVADVAQEGLDTAQEGLDAAQDAVEEAVNDDSDAAEEVVIEDDSESEAYDGPIFTIEDVLGAYTFFDPANDWHYAEITRDGDILKWTNRAGIEWGLTPDFENGRLLTDDSFPYQNEFQNFDLVAENGAYTGFNSNNEFWKHEGQAVAQASVDTDGPAGGTFEVDPTEPIEVAGTNGTEVSVDAGGFVDENGEPPAGDVTVNVFTDEVGDDVDDSEDSTHCLEPVLTVWSYDEETGLWIEEAVAPVDGDSCVDSIGTVAVDVTDEGGNDFDLAEGETAEVAIPCEPTPDEVLTVWSYDEETGLWIEEATDVIVEGNTCSAEVSDPSNVVIGTEEKPLYEELQDAVLQGPLVMTGLVIGTEGTSGVVSEMSIADGYVFEQLSTFYVGSDYPIANLKRGEATSGVLIHPEGAYQNQLVIWNAQSSGTELGAAAMNNLLDTATAVTKINVNNPAMAGDVIEVTLINESSSEPPYLVSIYRGDSRQLIMEFEMGSGPVETTWDFDISVNQTMSSDGAVADSSGAYDFVIQLDIDGEVITGEYLETSSGACSEATIAGTTIGDAAQFTITYFGGCCPDNQMEFNGTFNADKTSLSGTLEPVGTPVSCTLWFADMTGTRR